MNEAVAKAVAEATRVAIQVLLQAWAERMHNILLYNVVLI